MNIKLNGETKKISGGLTLAQLIAELKIEGPLAVEFNGELLEEAQFAQTTLAEGDGIEILRFVGGG